MSSSIVYSCFRRDNDIAFWLIWSYNGWISKNKMKIFGCCRDKMQCGEQGGAGAGQLVGGVVGTGSSAACPAAWRPQWGRAISRTARATERGWRTPARARRPPEGPTSHQPVSRSSTRPTNQQPLQLTSSMMTTSGI